MVEQGKVTVAKNGREDSTAAAAVKGPPQKCDSYEQAAPPDGGWGWVIVFASFMIHVVSKYTLGIFYFRSSPFPLVSPYVVELISNAFEKQLSIQLTPPRDNARGNITNQNHPGRVIVDLHTE